MLTYLKSFFNSYFNNSSCESEHDKEEYLAEQLLNIELNEQAIADSNELSLRSLNNEIPRDVQCFERTGVVTYVDSDHILIDGILYFEQSTCSLSLNINEKVSYLGYKDENGSIIIARILKSNGFIWDDECYDENAEENKYKVFDHIIVGEVDYREKRNVYIKETDLKFSLDDVEGTFVPIKGDWLELKCKVQWDENKPSDISAEQVLKVMSFKPLRTKMTTGFITEWSGEEGICDNQIYCSKHCVQDGFTPSIGSKVSIEAIESNQGVCPWRAIKLLILLSNETKSNIRSLLNIEDSSLKIEAEQDIDITYPLKFEKVKFNEGATMQIKIHNKSNEIHMINKWIVLNKKRDSQINITPVLTRPKRLYPKETFSFNIICKPKFMGSTKEHLIIMFRGFQATRFIEINVLDEHIKNIHSEVKKKNTTEKKNLEIMQQIRRRNGKVVPGVKLRKPPAFIPVKLGIFPIPEKIWNAVLCDSTKTTNRSEHFEILKRMETNLPCLSQNLNISNYTDRWHTLLYMEEIHQNIDMRAYDIPKTFLIKCQEYLGIEILGLAERKPSIMKGDMVIVKDIWDANSPQYEGYIHIIKGNLVLLKFHQRFHESYSGSDVSIEFHFSRSTYRKAHQAINLAISNLGAELLFPSRILSRPFQVSHESIQSIKWFNENLNLEQKAAVTNILLGESRPLPYCIYGPPGTGKTVTVTETILQILTMVPDSRILVATSSNSASNLITERLLQYRYAFSDSMIRLIANYLVDSDNLPEIIKPFCATINIATEDTSKSSHNIKNGINLNCQSSYIGRHRVTIGTCCCLGSLAQIGLPKGHFSHIIVDEAGQATEPEIMIALTFVDKENGQIILAGDPMQLGPVIFSKYCLEFGMDETYFSRILETFPYEKDFVSFQNGFNNKLVTKLNVNYRSLQEVIMLPSKMFYDSSIVAKINRQQPWINKFLDVLSDILDLPNSKTGGIFVNGIKGFNARAEDSPSWYNPQEASMVAMTTCKLYKRNVNPNDIGIITPYVAQIQYIKLIFEALGLPQTKIGTVEEFQGQEKPIIIISTVRSSESNLLEDQRYTLGFIKNPKRLNVALTRGQVAVLLFCDPYLLSTDPLWNRVIKTAIEEDKYVGCDYTYEHVSNIEHI